MALSEDAIIETAERLLAETGRVPTVEQVREALGGGSFSTLNPVLRAWRQQQQAAQAVAGEIPARVREALERAAGGLWNALRAEVEERIEQARAAAEQRGADAEQERDQALHEVQRLETALAAQAEDARRRETDLQAALEQLREQCSGAREQIATLTERSAQQDRQLDQARQDAERQRQALEQLHAQLDAERDARGRAERDAAELRTEHARLQARGALAEELREQLCTLQAQFQTLANERPPPRRSRKRDTPA